MIERQPPHATAPPTGRPPSGPAAEARPRLPLVCAAAVGVADLLLFLYAWPRTEVRVWEIATCGVLIGCGIVCAEAARAVDEDADQRDLLGVWWLPVIVLLPPVYALSAPVVVLAWVAMRRRHACALPWPLEAGLVGLCASVASAGFDAAVMIRPAPAEDGPIPGAAALLAGGWGIAVALLCGLLFALLRIALAAAAEPCRGPAPSSGTVPQGASEAGRASCRRAEFDSESAALVAAELGAGVSVGVLCALSPPLVLVALPPVLLLQRSLLVRPLRDAARYDHKTGLLNAGAWQRAADRALVRAAAQGRPASVLMVDVDHFKRVNDTHGHLVGDRVLLGVGEALVRATRDADVVGRFGGEEFVVLLPEADADRAVRAAEEVRAHVGRTPIPAGNQAVGVTVSVGVAQAPRSDTALNELIAAADRALYAAKRAGRDRVHTAGV